MSDQPPTIEVEATVTNPAPAAAPQPAPAAAQPQQQSQALVRSAGTGGAIGPALSVAEIHERLEFVRRVMKEEMRDKTDYGKIPGCGEKPTLLQPGAQKLLMTFGLREQVKRETLREFPQLQPFGHREYEIVVTVFPAGQSPDNGWDGVGTCSTLEENYRYRKANIKCPNCGKETVLRSKKPGEGWFCWAKKGGCGTQFGLNDARISGQSVGKSDNPNPADCWNTCRKMAFKRALVAAAINATNTSDLWTQDIEDNPRQYGGTTDEYLPEEEAANAPRSPSGASGAPTGSPRAANPAPAPASHGAAPRPAASVAAATPKKRYATAETKAWMVAELEKAGFALPFVTEFMQKATRNNSSPLLPTETLEDLPLRWVPITRDQLNQLVAAITDFGNGSEPKMPYDPNEEAPPEKKAKGQEKPAAAKPAPAAPSPAPPASTNGAPEWFLQVIVPVPRRGMKRDEYLKHPDTIGSLYEASHDRTDDGQESRQRLWGFLHNFEPKGWTKRDGTPMPASQADIKFREALDAFGDWHAKTHPNEKL